ncbi:MAG TPA: hypothetical protein VE821_09410, partial [Pyrinomonadaceae bacterium]|nr:hypothetical protein [Pyrinomonadaceae bacterium]
MLRHSLRCALAPGFIQINTRLRVQLPVVVGGKDNRALCGERIFRREHQHAQKSLASARGVQDLHDERSNVRRNQIDGGRGSNLPGGNLLAGALRFPFGALQIELRSEFLKLRGSFLETLERR